MKILFSGGTAMVLIRKKKKKTPEELEVERQEKELQRAGIQDEFQAKGFELATWAQDHKVTITTALSVLAIGLLVWVGIGHFSQGSLLAANAEYERALKLADGLRGSAKENDAELDKALKAFVDVSNNHKGTKVEKFASLYVGDLALRKKDYKVALEAFQRAADASPKSDSLRVVALLGLANALESNQQNDKALAVLESIFQEGIDIEEPMLLWQAHRLAKVIGENKKSNEFASQLLDRYPSSVYAQQVQTVETKSE